MTFKKYSTAIFAALLAALVLAVYWQTTGFEFISLDDLEYTVLNPVVKGGLTGEGVKEAFTSTHLHAYVPVTLLSFMADVELFSLKPSGFHFTNTILHLLNTILLFAFLYRATGSSWKSFFTAALWSIHPMRAESVAWVAERKDVLAGFFFLAGLIAYCEYAKNRKPAFYIATFSAMFLGLLSKPVLVVFPAVLLITDFWPLERVKEQGENLKKLLIEKIPFIALSVLFSALTVVIQRGTIYTIERRSALARLSDIAASYVHYLKETAWPFGLIMKTRSPEAYVIGVWALAAGFLIIAFTFTAWRVRKTAPAVTAGWLWYLAVLFPVSGVLPLDFYFVADHFTYLPHIGLIVAIVWGAERLYSRFAKDLRPLTVAGGVIAVVLSVLCFRQVSLWKDDFTLFGYIDNVTGGKSALAKFSLGLANSRAEKHREAYDKYGEALALEPNFVRVNGYKGMAAANLGRYREAADLLRKELEIFPGDRDFCTRLASILILAGDLPGAARQGLENIKKWPEDKMAWDAVNYLGGEARAREIAGR
ncbi:hypothetical protein EPN96_12035 [bacterium]|nr:MAG: hypothetical protein EPN96_12035 [bacterium]